MSIRKHVHVNNTSIEKAGIPRDVKQAVSEYIWNGLDAGATEVSICYKKNVLTAIDSFSIEDNGSGIDFNTIDNTFGLLLDSQKSTSASMSSYFHGVKGRGRFSFQCFAAKAEWNTIFQKDGKKYKSTIEIDADSKEDFTITEPAEIDNKTAPTGTAVKFINLKDSINQIDTKEFSEFFKREFGWYLHLKKNNKIIIKINGIPLDYSSIIMNTESIDVTIPETDKDYTFSLNFIEWKSNIGDDYYYYYFLDKNYSGMGKKTTSFNKNGINFHHSVYVVSDYFSSYDISPQVGVEYQMSLIEKDEVYKKLLKELHNFLERKRKEFIKRNADILIDRLESEGVLPDFKKDKYDQEKKKDLVSVAKSIFKIEPRLFIGVSELQKKSFLGFLNLLLDSEERANILTIISGLVNDLSPEEREDLAKVLEKTSFNKVVRTLKQVACRIKNIQMLKTLIYEFETFTNERDHIQKIMEESFWLFGEQYNMVSNDKIFQKALESYYVNILQKDLPKEKLTDPEKHRRPDLFLARTLPISRDSVTLLEENIIVELKRPEVVIGMEQFRQVQDYLQFISRHPQFNSSTRMWKFYIVGKDLDNAIKARIHTSQKDGKEPFIIDRVENYSIYAMTWDDLFQTFLMRNNYILEKLDLDKQAVLNELEYEGVPPEEIPTFLTQKVSKAN